MQVTVKTLDSETRLFTVSEEATVEEFKSQIAADVNIPAERQRLIFKGKVLQDSTKLQSYGVDGCVVHLVERRPPSQRSHPDGASSERSSHDHNHEADGAGFNLPTDVMNISQQIIQGLVSQLGLNSAQANVSTSQSGDGSTLNVHINLLASANGNDACVRISRARQFLRAARNSLNRSEGESSVLPGSSNETMDTSSSSTSNSQQNTTTSNQQTSSQSQTDTNTNQNNSPNNLADVLGELLEFNTTMQPHLERYRTLLNSNNTENLLPSDDSLPDHVAESLHNLSHAYHALSDLTFNFRSPEPRQLNVLPSLSNHVGGAPFLSSLFGGGGSQSGVPPHPPTQASQNQGDARIHVVPGGSAIAFTSIISGSVPPSSIYNPQSNSSTTGGPNRMDSAPMFGFNFGSHGNNPMTSGSNTSSGGTTTTSSQSTPQGGDSGENVRIVMDDIVALFSSAQPVTSHSETSRTNTTSQQSSTNNTNTQTQNSGSTANTSRTVPRINIRSLPLHGNHQDPLVPCESFHFGPRSRQPQGTQPGGNANPPANLQQAFSDAIASAFQESMAAQARGDQTSPETTTQTAGSTTTSNTTSSTGSTTQTGSHFMPGSVFPLAQMLSAIQNMEQQEQQPPSQSASVQTASRRNPDTREFEILQNAVMDSFGQAVRGEETLLTQLVSRFGRTMSLQDLIFMLMGMPQPYSRLRTVVHEYLHTDLLDGSTPTDDNIHNAASRVTSELLGSAGDLLDLVPAVEGVDVKASISCFLENAINTAFKMSRDLDDAAFAARFPDHFKRSSTDLCILLAMCFRDGVRGATNFVGMRLPETMTRDVDPFMLQTLQATLVSYVDSANRQRPQREEALRQYIKQVQPQDEALARDDEETLAEASDANSQRSDDSDSFVTPPLSLSANDNDQYTQLEEEEDEDEKHEDPMELDENDEEWKTVVPEDWVPIIARDVIRQRRLPQPSPFSDAYLSGFPPKRRKTADERAMRSTRDNMPSMLRHAVVAAGVTPRTSMEALEADARQSTHLHQGFRQEVQKAVKTRTSKDEDYSPDRFPSTKDYIEKS